jgi:hypothetical protein
MVESVPNALGKESVRLDYQLAKTIPEETRAEIWRSVGRILERGPLCKGSPGTTGLALGYVQSGKTTSICALISRAADDGYSIIIAFLGVTNLLLNQNLARIESALGLNERNDFQWLTEANPSGRRTASRIEDYLDRGRTVFLPVLKHAGRIDKLSEVLRLANVDSRAVLIIDDEADQTSLNTETASSTAQLSRTYSAITKLRYSVPRNLYVQYTATPYAPLLIDPSDHLQPSFVEFLKPGPGYTGGREFFVDHAAKVVRDVPMLEEQNNQAPIELPKTLLTALGSFVAGAALLLAKEPLGAPVSMLVHSTHRNDIQERYHFLLDRLIRQWRTTTIAATEIEDLPSEITAERTRLVALGAQDAADSDFLDQVRFVIREAEIWLVNSAAAVNKVNWNVAPIHILVGGNKLDRGFTVEGLTVTYMNRKPSEQIDTLEQRARAFGYRGDQLPYCQFFASKRTVKILRDVVFTEYDLRARLQDHIDGGGTVESWSSQVGLLLPAGTKPTRSNVVRALSKVTPGWHSLRRPALDSESLAFNRGLIESLGLFEANEIDYGRLKHRSLWVPVEDLVGRVLERWRTDSYSPDWRHEDLMMVLDFVKRHPFQDELVPVILMQAESGGPRSRQWDPGTGFINLFQGRDVRHNPGQPFYPGDRNIKGLESNPDQLVLQVHKVVRSGDPTGLEILTLAVHLGERPIIRAKS